MNKVVIHALLARSEIDLDGALIELTKGPGDDSLMVGRLSLKTKAAEMLEVGRMYEIEIRALEEDEMF